MADESRREGVSVCDYGFVITILWIGFVLAIGFMETPLRFSAESITLPLALQIGRLVFHALNICELVFAAGILWLGLWCGSSVFSKGCWLVAAGILLAQTWILFLVLDVRTQAVIDGVAVGESSVHTIYIVLEMLKLLVLTLLAWSQLRDFRVQLLKDAS